MNTLRTIFAGHKILASLVLHYRAQGDTPMRVITTVFLALVGFTTVTPCLHADNIGLTLKTGAVTDVLVETPILNGEQFTYTHETLGILSNGNLLNSST